MVEFTKDVLAFAAVIALSAVCAAWVCVWVAVERAGLGQ